MNKILIVGHQASGCQQVEALLHQCGMGSAQPSRREGLHPQDITATLCKAHNAPAADTVLVEEDFQQIAAGPVWHGMALDLMLGNLEQALWGWVDSQAIYTLDYWKSLDPKLAFVLVYDEPQRVLTEAAASGQPLTESAVQQLLDNWAAYNGALLRFFLRNSERCLLVHSQQVRRAVDTYLQQLQPLIEAPLALSAAPAAGQYLPEQREDGDGAEDAQDAAASLLLAEASSRLPKAITKAAATVGLEPQEIADLSDIGTVEHYLASRVLENHPASQQIYAELQSTANLPLDGNKTVHGSPVSAWSTVVRQRVVMTELIEQLHAYYQRSQETVRLENELMLNQLHQVQEEFEQQSLRKQELEQRASKLQGDNKQLRAKIEAAEKIAASNAQKLKELTQENGLLLSQLHQVQEELERYYLENKHLKAKLAPKKLYGAADRVKRQLSYRLGATMIQHSRSLGGWLSMPWALIDEVRAFRKERAAGARQKLPPIHTYADAHKAERVKRHLSYRLGQTMLKHANSPLGWLKLPFALRREVNDFRKWREEAAA